MCRIRVSKVHKNNLIKNCQDSYSILPSNILFACILRSRRNFFIEVLKAYKMVFSTIKYSKCKNMVYNESFKDKELRTVKTGL